MGQFGKRQRLLVLALFCIYGLSPIQTMQVVFVGNSQQSQQVRCFYQANSNNTAFRQRLNNSASDSNNGSRGSWTQTEFLNDSEIVDNNGFFSRTTVVDEWGLTCSEAYKVQLTQALFMFGALFGAPLFGAMMDRHGRRLPLFVTTAGLSVVTAVTAFSPHYGVYLALRFLAGMTQPCIAIGTHTLAVEMVGVRYRAVCATIMNMGFATGILVLVLFAYIFPLWRHLYLALSVFTLLLSTLYFVVPESPRWLIAQKRVEAGLQILYKIAESNSRELPRNLHLLEPEGRSDGGSGEKEPGNLVVVIFRHRTIRRRVCIMIYAGIVVFVGTYVLILNAGSLGLNIYSTFAVVGLLNHTGNALTGLMLNYLGRRRTLAVLMALTGLACCLRFFLALFTKTSAISSVQLVLAFVGIFSTCASVGVFFFYLAELLPTTVRSTGCGLGRTAGRLGSMLAPLLLMATAGLRDEGTANVPDLLCGVLAFSVLLLAYCLPETRGRPLQQTTAEVSETGQ